MVYTVNYLHQKIWVATLAEVAAELTGQVFYLLLLLYSRFVSFIQAIRKHPKLPVQFLFNLVKDNVMSVTGKNTRMILAHTGQEDILKVKKSDLKKDLKFCAIEDENKWKVEIIKELVNVKQGKATLEGEDGGNMLTSTEIDEIITYLSTC